ncbi:TIGR01777 family oxidoreductase [bacterium]|nr:TIGR01777 family oxidoreductase [bacterium]
MKIVLAGATGFIGKFLIQSLQKAHHTMVVLTRRNIKIDGTIAVQWDARTLGQWSEYIDGADAVINLSGESIAAKRWNNDQKKRLTDSRVLTTRVLIQSMAKASKKPHSLINASAVGYYGHVEDSDVTESRLPADDFMGKLCRDWETEALKAEDFGVRVVLPRIGIVLGGDGGALQKMALPFKFFIGGPLGSGYQWMPWIHRDDVITGFQFVLNQINLRGPVNFTAPDPVRMKDFCKTLGTILRRPSWAPVPSFALKLLLGEMAAIVTNGQKAVPKKLIEAGFEFKYTDLKKALSAALTG